MVTLIGIIEQHCENSNMLYISQSTKNRLRNRDFTAQNRTNVWVVITCIKEPETTQQVLEAISSQKPTGKCNRFNVITSCRDKNIAIKIFRKIYIYIQLNQKSQVIGNKIISIPSKHTTIYNIGDVYKISLGSDWLDSIFSNDNKVAK